MYMAVKFKSWREKHFRWPTAPNYSPWRRCRRADADQQVDRLAGLAACERYER
jgi:hypothetical protein